MGAVTGQPDMKSGSLGAVVIPWLLALAGIALVMFMAGAGAWTLAVLAAALALLTATRHYAAPAGPRAPIPRGRSLVTAIRAPRPRLSDSAHTPIVIGSLACVVFFGGLATWSAYARIERTATGPAVLRYEASRAPVHHPDGGTIAEVLVKEGEAVGKDHVLLRLETVHLTEELRRRMRRHDGLSAQNARLLAEQAGSDAVTYPAKLVERAENDYELAGMMAAENSALRAANEAFRTGLAVLNQRAVELEQRAGNLAAQKEGAAMRLRRTQEERGEVEQLVKRGLTPPERLVALRDEQARLASQVQGLATDIADIRAALEQARQAAPNFERDRQSRIARDLAGLETERAALEPRIEDILARLARAELRAPAAGVVAGVAQFAAGAVLPGGSMPVLEIVSQQKKLVAEARMHPFARSVLEPGMEARVRLITAGLQESEPVPGRLAEISAEAVTDRETNEAYYVAIVEIPSRRLAASQPAIRPGTPAEVIIPILDRTPLLYLFEPLVRKRELAMRQP